MKYIIIVNLVLILLIIITLLYYIYVKIKNRYIKELFTDNNIRQISFCNILILFKNFNYNNNKYGL